MSFTHFPHPRDAKVNRKLMGILSAQGVTMDDLELTWELAFFFVSSKGKDTRIDNGINAKVLTIKKIPIKGSHGMDFFVAVIRVFGHIVTFEYNESLKRVSFKYNLPKKLGKK